MKKGIILGIVFTILAVTAYAFGFRDLGNVSVAAVPLNTLAEKELIKHFRHENTWLEVVPSKDNWVNNDVIKLTEIGADPEVLINNNTYPIATSSRVDDGIAISLYKYDTENTKITDDEQYALPSDKPGSVQEQHREALEEKTAEHALHSIAPFEDDATAKTFIIDTTGEDDGNGRKRLTYKDLVTLKTKMDTAKVLKTGRILVLCSEHIADLLLEDKALNVQYQNHTNGVISPNYCGFKIYESVYNPVYDANNQKKAFDAAPASTDKNASVAFYAKNTAKARGSVKRYMRDSSVDPENRETVVGFRLYHIAVPTKRVGLSAIVSATV